MEIRPTEAVCLSDIDAADPIKLKKIRHCVAA